VGPNVAKRGSAAIALTLFALSGVYCGPVTGRSFAEGSVRAVSGDAQRGPAGPVIRVERVAAGRWRVTYRLGEPTPALVFDRPAGFYRERAWSVVTPGYAFARRDDRQVLEVSPGRDAAAEIVIELGEFREQLPREYELFVGFADGGVALYTGHLYARPDGVGGPERPSIRTLEIVPPAGTRAVLRGGVHDGPFEWPDGVGDGTYVHFGSTEPAETDDMIAVLDGELPGWLRSQFESWLPRLFAIYSERLEVELPWKPVVLYGFEDVDRPGLSWGGGTLTGLIQLTVSGTEWREPTAEGERSALGFLAHEAAHLWNGQLVRSAGGRSPWMHEGSADALAGHLLEELGLIDADGLRERYERALNTCLQLTGTVSPNAAADPRVPYECGQLMALWTVAALRRSGSETDLFGFWSALIEGALRNPPASPGEARGEYDEALYLATLADFGVERDARERFRAFLAEAEGDRTEMALAGLGAEGLALEPTETAPEVYRVELARRAMTHLMSAACDGRYSFDSGSAFRTYAIPDCDPFAEPLEVHRIAGFRVDTEGDALYDRVAERCAAGDAIALEDAGDAVIAEAPCARRLEPRRPWLRLASLP